MPTDVFISYATADRRFADEVCLRLETEHLTCWIAPRDMTPGQDWSKSLVEAINSVRMLVVVLSSQTCSSRHVPREVEQADRDGKVIIPIWADEGCELSGQLAYYLNGLQAIRGKSVQDSVDELVRAVQATLGGQQRGAVTPVIQREQVSDDDYVALARAICRNIREQISEMATNEDAITIAEPVHGKQVKFIDIASNRAARKAISQWAARHATSVHLVGEDIAEAFPVKTDLPVVCVLDSLDGTQHWLRGKNLYCTALSIFARTDATSTFRLRVSAIQRPDGALLIAREDQRAAYVDGQSRPIELNVSNAAEDMGSAHVCTVCRRPDHYRVLIRHLASGSPFSGLYTFGGNPALADLALGAYDAVFQPDASAVQDSQPIWDWLPGGHILLRAGGRIFSLDGSQLDVVSAAESSINTGGGHYPYVAAHTEQLAAAIVHWLASH